MAGTASALDLANTCAGCHGIDGNSKGPAIPSIAEMSAEYFTEAMKGYKSDEPAKNTVMTRIAKGYSDAEIDLMAGYFAKQTMVRQKQDFDATQAKAGAKLHKKYCEKCHEDGGRSAEDDSGILAGQWAPYLHYTMADYIAGDRQMPKKMKKKVKKALKADPKAMEKLIHYYGSQK
ncbi:MAG: c-type cytochrome [Gammaproteobacteria bacterium]|nr:c-type cytochrome [Gammaproteobacteria bacterium]